MTDKEIINVGDICLYFYDNDNKSISVVEVVKNLSIDVVVVKFLQVFVDDSGNGFFDYLHRAEKTMNVSRKYLHKIDLIDRQQAEIERLKKGWKADVIETAEAKAEAVKEFAERLKKEGFEVEEVYVDVVDVETIDDLVKEMVGDTE